MTLTANRFAVRVGTSVSLAISGWVHADLYADGYRHVPIIGSSFLVQASLSFALAVLILVGGPWWLGVGASVVALGALAAFASSRTIGVLGFVEVGWQPTPYAALAVIAEAATLVLSGAALVGARRRITRASTI